MNDKYITEKYCGSFAVHERRFFFNTTMKKRRKVINMKQKEELDYYEEIKDWNFEMFEIESEKFTDWDMYEKLNQLATKNSKILDLGTGGGEKVIQFFPECQEILGTDFSEGMIETAKENLKHSQRKNISFRLMDNLKMDVPKNYFDIVVARNTITDPKQIYDCLKPGGYLLIHGVDKYDCWSLKMTFGYGQAFHDKKPISIIDYENVLKAGFEDVELIPIHEREFFKNQHLFTEFLKKVPILDDFSEEEQDNKDYYKNYIDDKKLDEYVKHNTYNGKIRLLRRYYGIIAKK